MSYIALKGSGGAQLPTWYHVIVQLGQHRGILDLVIALRSLLWATFMHLELMETNILPKTHIYTHVLAPLSVSTTSSGVGLDGGSFE